MIDLSNQNIFLFRLAVMKKLYLEENLQKCELVVIIPVQMAEAEPICSVLLLLVCVIWFAGC